MGFNQNQWSLTHAFFADSGGVVLEHQNEDPFPLSAKQLAWLVEKKYTRLPEIKEKDISDKSKAEICTKAFAICQTTWFMLQLVCRAIEHLPVTPLELASAALALTSLTTLAFWIHKPKDVQQPYIVRIDAPSSTDGTGSKTDTPSEVFVDFAILEQLEPGAYISRRWSRRLLHLICRIGLQKNRINRIPNDRDPQPLGYRQHVALGVATAAFASIHFVDWNFAFATKAEAVIWRTNCCIMWALLAVYGTAEVIICSTENYQKSGLDTGGGYKLRWPACLWFFVPATIYFCARLVLIVAIFVNLRSLPERTFVQAQWTAVLPHI